MVLCRALFWVPKCLTTHAMLLALIHITDSSARSSHELSVSSQGRINCCFLSLSTFDVPAPLERALFCFFSIPVFRRLLLFRSRKTRGEPPKPHTGHSKTCPTCVAQKESQTEAVGASVLLSYLRLQMSKTLSITTTGLLHGTSGFSSLLHTFTSAKTQQRHARGPVS